MWKKRKKKNENIQRQYLVRKNPQMVWMKMRAAANATNLICAHRKHSIGSCVTMEWDMVLAVNQIILLNGTHISFGVYLPFAYVNSINKQLLAPCIFLIGWFSRLLLSCSVDDSLSLSISLSQFRAFFLHSQHEFMATCPSRPCHMHKVVVVSVPPQPYLVRGFQQITKLVQMRIRNVL